MSYFIVEFPLKTVMWQEHILDKRFELARHLYNSLASVMLKRYMEMIKTKKYRQLMEDFRSDDLEKKEVAKVAMNNWRKELNFSEFGFMKEIKDMRNIFKKNIDANTGQNIASNVWKAFEKLIFGNGTKIHFKKYGELNTVQGTTNKSGIRFFPEKRLMIWNKLSIPVLINDKKMYEVEALSNRVVYSTIVRKTIKNKNRYFLQVTFDGIPPRKIDKETGLFKHNLGKGDVGVFITPSTLYAVGENGILIRKLAEGVQSIENDIRSLMRKMDRSRRKMNPDNFNADGTIKVQKGQRLVWNNSKHYLKMQQELKSLYRKQAVTRKIEHHKLVYELLELGNKFYFEKTDFVALARKKNKTETDEKTDKIKSKKCFGKVIGNRAPSMFVEILKRKLASYDEEFNVVRLKKGKDFQRVDAFDHLTGLFNAPIEKQFKHIGEDSIQRFLYNAFLLQNTNADKLNKIDTEKCIERFDTFKTMHDTYLENLNN